MHFKKFSSVKPNLFSLFPVEILLIVFASISGFSLIPISTIFLFFFAIFSISKISLSDSQLISKIFFSIAYSSSSYDFPTPEKTIFFADIPFFSAFNNSPIETTSAPKPDSFISFKI